MAKELEVEIFAVGKWNGTEFTKEDLQSMAHAYNTLKEVHDVPLKFGHNDKQPMTDGQPALGWVENVFVKGTKLLAKFVDIPNIVAKALEKKLYKKVSIELDLGVDHNDQHFPYVLSGVALLGADIPAVNTLADLQAYMERDPKDTLVFEKRMAFTAIETKSKTQRSNSMSGEDEGLKAEFAALKIRFDKMDDAYQKVVDENTELKKERTEKRAEFAAVEKREAERKLKEQRDLLSAQLDGLVKEKKIAPFMRDDFLKDYDEAEDKMHVMFAVEKLEKTIATNPAYFGVEQARIKAEQEAQENQMEASEIVVQRTREYMAQHGEKDFSIAKTAVLRADRELAEKYTKMEG